MRTGKLKARLRKTIFNSIRTDRRGWSYSKDGNTIKNKGFMVEIYVGKGPLFYGLVSRTGAKVCSLAPYEKIKLHKALEDWAYFTGTSLHSKKDRERIAKKAKEELDIMLRYETLANK